MSRTEVLSAPWSRDSLFSARKTFLPQVFRICGPHTTQSPTDPTQINKCTSRWPKQLLWAFIQNFWCKTFLRRGKKIQEEKVYTFKENQINGIPAKSETVTSIFLYIVFIWGNKGINGFVYRIYHSLWSTEYQIYNFTWGAYRFSVLQQYDPGISMSSWSIAIEPLCPLSIWADQPGQA